MFMNNTQTAFRRWIADNMQSHSYFPFPDPAPAESPADWLTMSETQFIKSLAEVSRIASLEIPEISSLATLEQPQVSRIYPNMEESVSSPRREKDIIKIVVKRERVDNLPLYECVMEKNSSQEFVDTIKDFLLELELTIEVSPIGVPKLVAVNSIELKEGVYDRNTPVVVSAD